MGVNWAPLTGYQVDSLETSFIVSGVIEGTIYQLRMQAKNIYGWGSYSIIKQIAAAGIPGQMDPPTTTNVGTNIAVTWVEPYDNSDAITAYQIYFKGSDY